MRNMKSLHIFLIIVIKKRREIPRVTLGKWKVKSHLGILKSKGQCNPKVTLEFYICNLFIWEKGRNFSSHTFCWSVNESRLFSSFSLVLWMWVVKYFVGLISCCSLPFVDYSIMLWVIWIILDVNMCCELFPSCKPNLVWLSS